MSLFAFEAFLDVNPTRITVAGTGLSVSYFVYLTLPDLLRFFPEGFVIMALGGALFSFSRYRYLPFVLAAFAAAFYFGVVHSTALADYYLSTYACHFSGAQYVCPLVNLVAGHPNIPLQGDVVGLGAFVLAVLSYAVSRLGAGIRLAVVEAFLVGSGSLALYEAAIYAWQPYWFTQKVTFYQSLLFLGGLTNQELLYAALCAFAVAALLRFSAWRPVRHRALRRTKKRGVAAICPRQGQMHSRPL